MTLVAMLVFCLTAQAGSFEDGVQAYTKGNYALAAQKFDQVIKAAPSNSGALLYAAMSYRGKGDQVKAREYYQQILSKFPGSQAAQYAGQALGVRSGQTPATASPNSSSNRQASIIQGSNPAASGGQDSLPQEVKVYFTKSARNKIIVDAYVNGRPTKLMFDTGAEGCYFTKDQIEALGIKAPDGPPTSKSFGAGNAEVGTWHMPLDIQVGPIKKRLTVGVGNAESDGEPALLGQTFFNGFEYDIDNGAHCIRFRKSVAAGGGRTASGNASLYSIPFSKRAGYGNDLEITVSVHGRSCRILFDTGAQTTMMSKANIKALGLEVPPDAERSAIIGVGGAIPAYHMVIDELRVGPVIRRDLQVSVVETGDGLLGQDVFQDWRYTIDNQNQQIKLFH
jgi:clan AA aspartic protease (TIGR02281 family)